MNQAFPCPVSGLFETVWQLFFYFYINAQYFCIIQFLFFFIFNYYY